MPFPNKATQFKPGESGNPKGLPKGTLHLSTHIQNMLNDESFEIKLRDGSLLKEVPIKAIIRTAIEKSLVGDTRAMEWLAKHGYGEKLSIEMENPIQLILQKYGLSGGANDRQDDDTVQGSSSRDSQD